MLISNFYPFTNRILYSGEEEKKGSLLWIFFLLFSCDPKTSRATTTWWERISTRKSTVHGGGILETQPSLILTRKLQYEVSWLIIIIIISISSRNTSTGNLFTDLHVGHDEQAPLPWMNLRTLAHDQNKELTVTTPPTHRAGIIWFDSSALYIHIYIYIYGIRARLTFGTNSVWCFME